MKVYTFPHFFISDNHILSEDSKLKDYLTRRCPRLVRRPESFGTTPFSLSFIMVLMHTIIRLYELFDPENPYIIVCDEMLEELFQVKAFHIHQLKTRVLLLLLNRETEYINPNTFITTLMPSRDAALRKKVLNATPTWGLEKSFGFRYLSTYNPRPLKQGLLLDLSLRRVLFPGTKRRTYSLNDVAQTFMRYVFDKGLISDIKNPTLAHFPLDHPLSKALGGIQYIDYHQLFRAIFACSKSANRPLPKTGED